MSSVKKKVFVASSSEVSGDRKALKEQLHFWNNEFSDPDSDLDVTLGTEFWEDISRIWVNGAIQTKYNERLLGADIVVFLIGSYVGNFTLVEFNALVDHLFSSGKNIGDKAVLVYFKDISISSLLITADFATNMESVASFKERIADLGQVYDTYENVHELLHKFDNELKRLLLPSLSRPAIGNLVFPSNSYIQYQTDKISSIDVTCNSGIKAITQNLSLFKNALLSGAKVRVLLNDPSSPFCNGSSTYSLSNCKHNSGQPEYTKDSLLHLHEIYSALQKKLKENLRVKFAKFCISGQLFIVNKKKIHYLPYVSNLNTEHVFHAEIDDHEELSGSFCASFDKAWNDSAFSTQEDVDISSKKFIENMYRDWVEMKKNHAGQIESTQSITFSL